MATDPYRYFRVEARELLEGVAKGVLELEKAEDVKGVVARLFRLAHTLKGAARVVRHKELAELSHALEDALQPLREGTVPITRAIVDQLLALSDAMAARAKTLEPAAAATPSPVASPERAASEEPRAALRADAEELEGLVEGVTELGAELALVRKSTGALEPIRKLAEVLRQRLGLRAADGAASASKLRATADELLGLLAGLDRDVAQSLERLERELRQVGEAAERLRLVPASAMFHVLERAARDAGVSVGKRVELTTRGGQVRLEPDVLAAVQAALVQAVRNAVAHGIEPEAARRAAGKPDTGRIVVEVSRQGSRIRFACQDDGRGVDFDAVRRGAERKGISAASLDEERLLELLLAGGISTSGEVTPVAGRGVGLDVVRETAERLNGRTSLSSASASGTLLELTVPVSRAALDALVVEADGQVVAIPLDAVERTLRVEPTDIARSAEGDSLTLDGRVVPFAPLGRSLRSGGAPRPSRAGSTVLVRAERRLAAVGVDRLLGTETVVTRPLPETMPAHAAVAGAMLDAAGNPRLVLDPEGLVASVERMTPAESAAPRDRPPILVIDDSLTTRMLEQSILESAGYEVELAMSAEEGLEKARARRYALFLVDVEMPGMDGFTFVELTRGDVSLREVPAILVTSRSSDDDRRRGASAGASAYIVKGEFDQTELLARIRTLVG